MIDPLLFGLMYGLNLFIIGLCCSMLGGLYLSDENGMALLVLLVEAAVGS